MLIKKHNGVQNGNFKMKVSKVKGSKLKVSKNYANGEAMLIDLISITMVEIKARMNYLVEKYPECFDDSDMQRIFGVFI